MRKQLGLSLVELMISITLGLVLITGVVQMFVSSKVVFNNQQALSRIQETGRLAMDFISRDVRMAAYYGCFRVNGQVGHMLQNNGLTIGGLHEKFDQGVVGYDKPALLPHGAATDLGTNITLVEDASVLVVRGATQVGNIINAPSNNNNLFAYSTLPVDAEGCVGALCTKPSSVVLASDCSKARVFKVNALAVAGTTLTINHLDSWSNFINGQVLPMNTIVYFLGYRTGSVVPSLWQRTNLDTPVELLEGVEKMRVTYATANDSTGLLDKGYRLAKDLAANEWAKVTSVRIELVATSLEKNVLSESQSYTFEDKEIKPGDTDAADHRLRQIFTSVVTIRSRMTVN